MDKKRHTIMDKQGEYKMNLHITMNGISFHKYMGDKVNQ